MVLKTKIKISQAKKAWTQYISIPSAVVQDSQYPFNAKDELHLQIEPTLSIMIVSRENRQLKITPEGVLVMQTTEKLLDEIEGKINPLVNEGDAK